MTDYFTAEQVYQSLKEENAALRKFCHEAQAENETLRMGYAAARLEIESLKACTWSEPVASYAIRMLVAAGHITQAKAEESLRLAAEFSHPSPPEGMVGWLQVYLCKIKSKKRIDMEIPRELQGWWADTAAGQKILLRQAVQSDLDRCNIGGKRSRNPTDYMCETHTGGSLVSKVALEYMIPEENVFAAQPTNPAGGRKGSES